MELHAQIACAMPRELARKGISWQARAVYTEAVLYCRENLTDGIISRGELPFWMADMPVKLRTRYLIDMATLGALLAHPDGWQFPEHVWRKWNPTKAQVDAKRAEETQRKAEYREQKRQERQGVPDMSQRDSHGTHSDRNVLETKCPGQPEPEPEPEPEPYKSLTQHGSLRAPLTDEAKSIETERIKAWADGLRLVEP